MVFQISNYQSRTIILLKNHAFRRTGWSGKCVKVFQSRIVQFATSFSFSSQRCSNGKLLRNFERALIITFVTSFLKGRSIKFMRRLSKDFPTINSSHYSAFCKSKMLMTVTVQPRRKETFYFKVAHFFS